MSTPPALTSRFTESAKRCSTARSGSRARPRRVRRSAATVPFEHARSPHRCARTLSRALRSASGSLSIAVTCARAELRRRDRQHARPGADVDDARAAQLDLLQQLQAEPRGGVMTRAETGGRVDDDERSVVADRGSMPGSRDRVRSGRSDRIPDRESHAIANRGRQAHPTAAR